MNYNNQRSNLFNRAIGFLLVAFFFTSMCFVAIVYAQTRTPAREQSLLDGNSIELLLERGRKLHKEGALQEAQKVYDQLLTLPLPENIAENQVRDEASEINMKLLFSLTKTDDSFFYTVEKGDSLYKIAQKFNTTIELIKRINGLTSSRIYPGQELKLIKSTFSIVVNKSTNVLEVRLKDRIFKTYRVATGKEKSTPTGEFEIINKLVNPTWFHAGAVVPSDSPENILGTRWMGFDLRGYGIHGTTIPESIGTYSTAGCVRMLNKDVEELYMIIPRGTKVKVVE